MWIRIVNNSQFFYYINKRLVSTVCTDGYKVVRYTEPYKQMIFSDHFLNKVLNSGTNYYYVLSIFFNVIIIKFQKKKKKFINKDKFVCFEKFICFILIFYKKYTFSSHEKSQLINMPLNIIVFFFQIYCFFLLKDPKKKC